MVPIVMFIHCRAGDPFTAEPFAIKMKAHKNMLVLDFAAKHATAKALWLLSGTNLPQSTPFSYKDVNWKFNIRLSQPSTSSHRRYRSQ